MIGRASVAVLASIAVAAVVPSAHAADLVTPTGGRGQFVLDQISGFRASSAPGTNGSFSYSGFIGFSYSHFSVDHGNPPGGYDAYNYTSFWLAPSLDYFVVEHLSVGALVEISTTSASRDTQDQVNARVVTTPLPATLNITLLPRVGYMIPIGDWHNGRFAIWPRIGAGYASRQYTVSDAKLTFSGFELNADVGFLLRVNETFFLKIAPEFVWIPGSVSTTVANVAVSNTASNVTFQVLGGIGVLL